MDQRFSLRFETSERRGEQIPIPAQGITVGRRPGNSLQILDNSVSGKHAELVVDAQGVLLRDLGSTNGTRIGPQRVLESRLAHGDRVFFGNVELSFQDASIGSAADPAGAPPVAFAATTVTVPADGMQRTSAELVLRSHKRSRVGLVAIAILAIGAAGLWWWLGRAGLPGASIARPVEAVPGNLLPGNYSFEGESDTWTSADGAPVAFLKTAIGQILGPSDARAPSGSFWMSCELAAGEWAWHRSPEVGATPGRALRALAKLSASEDVDIRLGLEFSAGHGADADGPHTVVAWFQRLEPGSGLHTVELTSSVPVGYDAVRVIIDARARGAGGRADFDDVSLVESSAVTAPERLGEFELAFLGDPQSCAVLSKSSKVLISGLEIAPRDTPSPRSATLEKREDGKLTHLVAGGSGAAPRVLHFVAESPLARARIASVGTTGSGSGFATHGLDFERADVVDLVLGSGRDLLRLKFASPVRVRGVADGSASRIAIEGELTEVALQHDFSAERTEAGNLAHAARNAEKKGELGACLKLWADLLNGYPYEDALVNEAEATRGRLIQQGLEELRGLREEVERARFFRLVDLYRQCREKARAVGQRYSPSEVEPEAAAVATEVQQELAGLEADLQRAERARLSAIQRALEAQKAHGLAAELASYLAEGH